MEKSVFDELKTINNCNACGCRTNKFYYPVYYGYSGFFCRDCARIIDRYIQEDEDKNLKKLKAKRHLKWWDK